MIEEIIVNKRGTAMSGQSLSEKRRRIISENGPGSIVATSSPQTESQFIVLEISSSTLSHSQTGTV